MPLERLNYFENQVLNAEDFRCEQAYFAELLSLQNRYLHTYGIAAGLTVTVGDDFRTVIISDGVAVDAQGRQICLSQARVLTVDASTYADQSFYVIMEYAEHLAEREQNDGNVGYKRIYEEAHIYFQLNEPKSGQLVLAELRSNAQGSIIQIQRELRRYVGLEVGAIQFSTYDLPSDEEPVIAADEWGSDFGLAVETATVSVLGKLQVDAKTTVGSDTVEMPLKVQNHDSLGLGTVSVSGRVVTGQGTWFTRQFKPGDYLIPRIKGNRGEACRIVRIIDDAHLELASPLDGAVGIPFELEKATARFGIDNQDTTLRVAKDCRVTVGNVPSGERLQVGGGNLRLDEGYALKFMKDGNIRNEQSTLQIHFDSTAGSLALQSTQQLSFSSAADAAGLPSKTLSIDENSRVAIGNIAADEMLTVDGIIQSMKGGFRFADGSIQESAAVPYPIGTILNWWGPLEKSGEDAAYDYDKYVPEGFVICRGQTITDENSPLVGVTIPDFSEEMFVRGATSFEVVGNVGGEDMHNHEYLLDVDHQHNYPHTHSIDYNIQAPEGGEECAWTTGSNTLVNKSHVHPINPSQCSQQSTSSQVTGQAVYEGGVDSVETGTASLLPPYVVLLKIMRIR